METIKDLKCLVCRKWVDLETVTCCESCRRICGECHQGMEFGTTCPACRETIDVDEVGHFQKDFNARKKVKTTQAPCKGCHREMAILELREHEQGCWSAEEAEIEDQEAEERDGESSDGEDEESSDGEDEEVREIQNDIMLDDQPPQPVGDGMRSCEFRRYGCLFQGTMNDLQHHLLTPPLEHQTAKELHIRWRVASSQNIERQRILDKLIGRLMSGEE